MESEGHYPNLPNCVDSEEHGFWRSELHCMETVDLMFYFSRKIHHCAILVQDACSSCSLAVNLMWCEAIKNYLLELNYIFQSK